MTHPPQKKQKIHYRTGIIMHFGTIVLVYFKPSLLIKMINNCQKYNTGVTMHFDIHANMDQRCINPLPDNKF